MALQVFFLGGASLYVVSHVPTELRWAAADLLVTLNVSGPGDVPSISAIGAPSELTMRIEPLPPSMRTSSWHSQQKLSHVRVRVPLWAREASRINAAAAKALRAEAHLSSGEALNMSTAPSSDFWSFDVDGRGLRAARASATIRVALPAALRAERLRDNRCEYRALTAVLFGPLVLAGLTSEYPRP